MTTLVLTFRGPEALFGAALAHLREYLPGGLLTPKSAGFVEARVNDFQADALRRHPDWHVQDVKYVQVPSLPLDLELVRQKYGVSME